MQAFYSYPRRGLTRVDSVFRSLHAARCWSLPILGFYSRFTVGSSRNRSTLLNQLVLTTTPQVL